MPRTDPFRMQSEVQDFPTRYPSKYSAKSLLSSAMERDCKASVIRFDTTDGDIMFRQTSHLDIWPYGYAKKLLIHAVDRGGRVMTQRKIGQSKDQQEEAWHIQVPMYQILDHLLRHISDGKRAWHRSNSSFCQVTNLHML